MSQPKLATNIQMAEHLEAIAHKAHMLALGLRAVTYGDATVVDVLGLELANIRDIRSKVLALTAWAEQRTQGRLVESDLKIEGGIVLERFGRSTIQSDLRARAYESGDNPDDHKAIKQ